MKSVESNTKATDYGDKTSADLLDLQRSIQKGPPNDIEMRLGRDTYIFSFSDYSFKKKNSSTAIDLFDRNGTKKNITLNEIESLTGYTTLVRYFRTGSQWKSFTLSKHGDGFVGTLGSAPFVYLVQKGHMPFGFDIIDENTVSIDGKNVDIQKIVKQKYYIQKQHGGVYEEYVLRTILKDGIVTVNVRKQSPSIPRSLSKSVSYYTSNISGLENVSYKYDTSKKSAVFSCTVDGVIYIFSFSEKKNNAIAIVGNTVSIKKGNIVFSFTKDEYGMMDFSIVRKDNKQEVVDNTGLQSDKREQKSDTKKSNNTEKKKQKDGDVKKEVASDGDVDDKYYKHVSLPFLCDGKECLGYDTRLFVHEDGSVVENNDLYVRKTHDGMFVYKTRWGPIPDQRLFYIKLRDIENINSGEKKPVTVRCMGQKSQVYLGVIIEQGKSFVRLYVPQELYSYILQYNNTDENDGYTSFRVVNISENTEQREYIKIQERIEGYGDIPESIGDVMYRKFVDGKKGLRLYYDPSWMYDGYTQIGTFTINKENIQKAQQGIAIEMDGPLWFTEKITMYIKNVNGRYVIQVDVPKKWIPGQESRETVNKELLRPITGYTLSNKSKQIREKYQQQGLDPCARHNSHCVSLGKSGGKHGFVGRRVPPRRGARSFHPGIDIATPIDNRYGSIENKEFHSPCAGKVVFSGDRGGSGKTVIIECNIGGKTYTMIFTHLNAIYVENGDNVNVGKALGKVGKSGVATGAHLHREMREGSYSEYQKGKTYTEKVEGKAKLVNPLDFVDLP